MKYFILLSLSLLLVLPMLAQNNDTINKTDVNNMKQGYWILKEDNSSQSSEEGRYLDDKKSGVWKKYFPSGKIKSEITYIAGKPDGYAKFYYENGKISEEGNWKGNKWTGQYKYYYENGKPSYDWTYNESGKRTGVQKYYHKNGNVMIEGEWKDGKESGVIKEYFADGSLKSEKAFVNGKLNEESVKIFDKNNNTPEVDNSNSTTVENDIPPENLKPFDGQGFHKLYKGGKIDREGEFKDSRLIDGKRYYYDSSGKLEKTNVYKNGRVVDIIYED